ncbi:hypothetical protein ABE527_18425 [Brucella sp. TWI432]
MDRGLAASNRGRPTGTCAQNSKPDFIELYEQQLAVHAGTERRMGYVVAILILMILFLGLSAMNSISAPSAMDRCLELSSFDTCFTTLNR